MIEKKNKLLFAINVDWYFNLHWKDRLQKDMASEFDLHLCMSETQKNRWKGFKFHPLKLSRSSINLISNLKTGWNAYKIFKFIKPDLIHSVTVKPNIIYGLIALWFRKPILITIPGLGSIFSVKGYKPLIIQGLLLTAYFFIGLNKKTFFIFENKTDLSFFLKIGICTELNSVAVPGAGVDINRFRNTPMRWHDNNNLKLLFAGRLLVEKGLHDLVSAVHNLRLKGFLINLSVAGIIDTDTHNAIPISTIEKWDHEGKLRWLGQIKKMENLIPGYHVVVLPTRYAEGLPRILLEANSCGRPVIATNVPGCNEFILNGKNGILYNGGDIASLEKAILKFMDKSFCERLGHYGRKYVTESFTDIQVIDCYKNVYLQQSLLT